MTVAHVAAVVFLVALVAAVVVGPRCARRQYVYANWPAPIPALAYLHSKGPRWRFWIIREYADWPPPLAGTRVG